MAIPLFLLVFVESAVLFQPSLGFEWKSSSPDDGANITACIGENVTFAWEYTVGEDEVVLSTEWHKITDKETFLAAHTSGYFLKFSQIKMNVQFLPNAGIQISNYTWADYATYRVTVKYIQNNGFHSASRTVILALPDVPVIAGDRLVAHVQPEPVLDTDTGDRHVQLTCGQFLSLGSMGPESVVWRIPSGKRVPSTSYSNGSFHLTLPNPVTGGPYHCYPSRAGRCVKNMLALRLGAHVKVDEAKARLMLLEGGVEILQDKDVETDSELKRQKEVDSSLQDELSEQNATDNQLMSDVLRLEEKMSLQEELKFNISVVEHKLAAQNATDKQLMSDVLRLKEGMSLQEETDSNHTSDIANLKERLKRDIEGVQEELQEQQKTDNSLKFNISAVENELYEQKATDNQLMSDVLRLEGKMSLQEETDNNHTSDISTLNKRMKTDVEGLQGALKEQQKTENHLKFNISVVEHKLAAQNATDNQLMSEVLHLKEGMSLQETTDNKHTSDIANLKSQMLLAEKTNETILSNVNSLQEILLLQEKTDETLSSDVDDIQEILAQHEKADQAMSSNMAELHKDLMKEKEIREELSSELDQLRSRLRETEQNLQSTFLELAANVTLHLKTLLQQAELKWTADIQELKQQIKEQTDCTLRVGARVRRGPDWEWWDQDGNPPGPGTVIRPQGTAGWIVKWDAGRQANYRMGFAGKYDLEVIC